MLRILQLVLILIALTACGFLQNQDSLEPPPEQDGMYQQLTTDSIQNPTGFIEDEKRLVANDTGDSDEEIIPMESRLPFQDFKERWNALSEEQGSKLFIKRFEKVETTEGTIFHAKLMGGLDLRVSVSDGRVKKLLVNEEGTSPTERFDFLTGMSQIYLILNPGTEPHHADYLFNELGIGPDANLENVVDKTIHYKGILYRIVQKNSEYRFEASYKD